MLLPKPNSNLQYATTAAFLSKIYGDYLDIIQVPGGSCSKFSFSLSMLQEFSRLQVRSASLYSARYQKKKHKQRPTS